MTYYGWPKTIWVTLWMTELSPDNLRPSPAWDSFRKPPGQASPRERRPRTKVLGGLGWTKAPRQVSGAEPPALAWRLSPDTFLRPICLGRLSSQVPGAGEA